MTTRLRTSSTLALVLGLSVAVTGCGKYSWSALKAQKAYKDGNAAYTAQDWRKAAENYEYALQQDPSRKEIHFYLANSYDNRFKPSRMGEADNDALMQKAIEHYTIASKEAPEPGTKKLALQYLVSAYGPDKLNDPTKAEPLVQEMIRLEPNEPSNYFALSNIYEQAGRYEDAEAALLKAREIRPNDAIVHTTLAGFYNRQGQFDKTMESLNHAAELEPSNPQGFYTVATFYEEKVRKDHTLSNKQKLDFSVKGIAAADKALALNDTFTDAMIFKGILLRHQATVETDRSKQQALLKEAVEIRDRAIEINKKRAAGQGTQ